MRVLVPVLAAVLLLSGCAGPRIAEVPAPSASATASASSSAASASASASAIDLVGGFWRVQDASGETADTWVAFDGTSAALFRPDGRIEFGWAAQGDRMLAARRSWSMSLGTRSDAPWMEAATRFVPDGAGWTLLDADGTVVARLVRDGGPAPAKDYTTDPPTLSPQATVALRPAVPGDGVHDEPASAFAGVWHVADARDVTLTLRDGGWSTKPSCESGTGANAGSGGYRVLDDGLLLVTQNGMTLIGCAIRQEVPPEGWRAVAGFGTARSFLVDGDELTVFDHDGKPLGTLVR